MVRRSRPRASASSTPPPTSSPRSSPESQKQLSTPFIAATGFKREWATLLHDSRGCFGSCVRCAWSARRDRGQLPAKVSHPRPTCSRNQMSRAVESIFVSSEHARLGVRRPSSTVSLDRFVTVLAGVSTYLAILRVSGNFPDDCLEPEELDHRRRRPRPSKVRKSEELLGRAQK